MKIDPKTIYKAVGTVLIVFLLLVIIEVASDSKEPDLELFFTLLLLFSGLALTLFFVIDRFIQKQKVKELKETSLIAEVDSLKAQINPHFFFNTLNNLYSLTVKKSQKAPEMILKLSDIMRYTIYEGAKERVSLKDEIEYLENYLELQEIRFQRKLDIKFDTSIENETIEIPPLLFIVLVENAFKHGAESLTENPYIKIQFNSSESEIYFEIENNCEPIKTSSSGGIGLKNLKRRLELIYPDKHKLLLDESTRGFFKATLEVKI